jgi:hypothetical protein
VRVSRWLWLGCGLGGLLFFVVSVFCLYGLGVRSRPLELFITPPFEVLGLVLTPREPYVIFFFLSCAIGLAYGFLLGAVVGAAIQWLIGVVDR